MSRWAGLAGLALLAVGAQAKAPAPAALADLDAGLWELRAVGGGAGNTRLCVTDMRQLFQPLQPRPLCRHFLSENSGDHAAVTYDCAARGQGRTALRVETPRLVRIDSQGVADGQPFAVRYEARRLGACADARR